MASTKTRMGSNLQTAVRDLQRRKARGRRGLAVVEGVRLVEEALAAGLEFKGALVAPELARTTRGSALAAELASHAVTIEEVGSRTFAELAGTETPRGILPNGHPRPWAPLAATPGPLAGVGGVPDPRGPANTKACAMRPLVMALRSVRVTACWPTTSSNRCGRHLRART